MIANLGHYSLIFLLIFAIFLLFIKKSIISKKILINVFSIKIILITIVLTTLEYSYIISDFSILNIKENSHISLPLLYKITALWGNHEGSILLWSFILIVLTFLIIFIFRNLSIIYLYKTVYIQNVFIIFFIIYTIFTSNPFIYTYIYSLNGSELNPILQDTVLAIHPPLIYIGYINSSINLSLVSISLIEKNYNEILKKYLNISGLITWIFLTIGILLGSWWSYYELGWGGWWFWDPVENSALLPWLLTLILIHSIKYEYLIRWTILVNISIFIFSILGTFFVRSGILVSVHSFAVDYSRGILIFVFLIILLILTGILYFKNIKYLYKHTYYSYKAIDNIITINNIIILIIFTTILLGTVLPTIYSMFLNKNISIGISFYNKTIIPMIIPILIIMSMITYINKIKEINNYIFSIGTLLFILFIIFIYRIDFSYYHLIILMLLLWLITSLIKYVSLYKIINPMILAHLGFFVFITGIIISSVSQLDSVQIVFPGEEINLENHIFNFRDINYITGLNYYSIYGNIAVINKGDYINILFPEKRYYFIKGIYITKSVIYSNYFADIYAIIGDGNFKSGWYTKYYYRPLMSFIWIGPMFFIFSALISIKKIISKKKIINWL